MSSLISSKRSGKADQVASSLFPSDRLDWWAKAYFGNDLGACAAFFDANFSAINPITTVSSLASPALLSESHNRDYWRALNGDPSRRKALAAQFGPGTIAVPVIGAFARQLASALKSLRLNAADAAAIQTAATKHVTDRLQQCALPSAMLAMNIARIRGETSGSTSEERATNFSEALLDERKRAFLIPGSGALDHLMAELATTSLQAAVDFAENFAQDKAAMMDWVGSDPGSISKIEFGAGDSHNGGKTVAIVEFEHIKLVYKPRSLQPDVAFNDLLAFLGRHLTDMPEGIPVLDRKDHGWAKFIPYRPCQTTQQVEIAFERLGILLAALHLVGASDIHYENLIFDGDHPYAVDLETLLTAMPGTRDNNGYAAASGLARAQSVLWIGYLPTPMMVGEHRVDLSAAGAVAAQPSPIQAMRATGLDGDCPHLESVDIKLETLGGTPSLDGQPVSAHLFSKQVIDGFQRAYRTLAKHRKELLAKDGPLGPFADITVRFVPRPTVNYALLLRNSYHPTVARDPTERLMSFARLQGQIEAEPNLAPLISAEVRDLRRGDVPHFNYRGNSPDLNASDRSVFPDYFTQTGFQRMLNRVSVLGDDDLYRQTTVIRRAFVASQLQGGPDQPKEAIEPTIVGSDELVRHAEEIGSRICREAFFADGMPYWFGATNLNAQQYGIGASDHSLYDGVAGIGIFMAELARKTAHPDHLRLASAALTAVRQSHLAPSRIGAFEGAAGLIYAERRISSALGLSEDVAFIEGHLEKIADQAPTCEQLDIIDGVAGAALVALECFDILPDLSERVATACANRLAEAAMREQGRASWPGAQHPDGLTGYSHGACGIAVALTAVSNMTESIELRELATAALAFERSTLDRNNRRWNDRRDGVDHAYAWCHGAPGMVLGRLMIRDLAPDIWPHLEEEIAIGLELIRRHGAGGSHCLCHGALGNAETLLHATSAHLPLAHGLARRAINEQHSEGRWRCGIAEFTETPGLMTGLSGIGLGLLRVADPSIPSILSLGLRK